jgi:uncharacterized membrane protein
MAAVVFGIIQLLITFMWFISTFVSAIICRALLDSRVEMDMYFVMFLIGWGILFIVPSGIMTTYNAVFSRGLSQVARDLEKILPEEEENLE